VAGSVNGRGGAGISTAGNRECCCCCGGDGELLRRLHDEGGGRARSAGSSYAASGTAAWLKGFLFLAQTSSYEDTRNNAKCRSFLENHTFDTIQLPFSKSKAIKNYCKRVNFSAAMGRDFSFSFVFKNGMCLQ
jgi:hypothetical protein